MQFFYYHNLDYGVINVVHDESLCADSGLYFAFEDEKCWGNICAIVKNKFQGYDVQLSIYSLHNIFKDITLKNNMENKFTYQLSIVSMISVLFILLCVQASRVINNKTKYGILFSNGFSPDNVVVMLLIENVIKWMMSLMLSGLIASWWLYATFATYPDILTRMTSNIKSFVLWPTIGISAGVMILGMIFPVIIIGKMAPSKLIKELGD